MPSKNEKFNISNNSCSNNNNSNDHYNIAVNLKNNDDIIKFINDIFIYLKRELQYIHGHQQYYYNNHYENELKRCTITAAMINKKSTCIQLLERCEKILQNLNNQQQFKFDDMKDDEKDSIQSSLVTSSPSAPIISKNRNVIFGSVMQIPADTKEVLSLPAINNPTESFNEENIYLEMNGNKVDKLKTQTISPVCTSSVSGEYIVFNNFENNINMRKFGEMGTVTDKLYDNYENHNYNSLKDKQKSKRGRQKNNKTNENISCPYFNVSIMNLKKPNRNIIKSDHLNRIEKRLFFEQKKIKLYCCILETWLLCYNLENIKVQNEADEQHQQHYPVLCINLKNSIEIELCNNKNKNESSNTVGNAANNDSGSNNTISNHNESTTLFQIDNKETTNKYLFQAKTCDDAVEWVNIIKNITNKTEKMNLNDKLMVEDVYEEPNPPPMSSKSDSLELCKNYIENEIVIKPNQYDKPPDIDLNKLTNNDDSEDKITDKNQKSYDEEINYVYDIPLRLSLLSQLKSNDNGTMNTINAPSTTTSSNTDTTDNKSEQKKLDDLNDFQSKVKDIHIKLSNQLSTSSLSTPSSSTIIKSDLLEKKISKIHKYNLSPSSLRKGNNNQQTKRDTIIITNNNTSGPIKNWFLNRLNLSSSNKWKKFKYRRMHLDKNISNTENNCYVNDTTGTTTAETVDTAIVSSTTTTITTTSTTEKIKGCRINTIINQLEANGHLSMITKNLNPAYNSQHQQQYQQQQFEEYSHNSDYSGYEPIVPTLNTTTFQNT